MYNTNVSTRREFRYVIVGAGSAGCLLARLLAQGQSEPVALIEAGRRESATDVRTVVPNFYPRTFRSKLDWDFATVPQAGLSGRRIAWPRGKLLGGSGAINALINMQAADADFERWGWPLPQLKHNSIAARSDAMPTSALDILPNSAPVQTPHPWSETFLEAAQAVGLQRMANWSKAEIDSCGYYQLAQRHGRRCHTGQFFSDDEHRQLKNIEVFANTHVAQLLLNKDRAIGVQILSPAGQLDTIHARGEVVLCAGAIGTPMLLMASGIGNPDELSAEKIACLHRLPWVGSNLQDHLVYPLIYATHDAHGLRRRHSPADRQLYRDTGTGPLASNIAEAGGLFSTGDVSTEIPIADDSEHAATPEFQLHFTPTHYLKYPRLDSRDSFFSLGVTDLHPRSRGQVRLVRHAGHWQPHIDPGYLTTTVDRVRFLSAIRWTRQLATQPGLRELIEHEALPGAKRVDEQGLCKSLETFAQSIFHPVGTCRMDCGKMSGAEKAVVDNEFRVHGLVDLRVVDASVLPTLPSCNTNAVTMQLALRAAKKLLS